MIRITRSLWRYRSLLATLTSRELKARYRGSVLGYLWSLVNPILLLLVYTIVFGTIFDPRDDSVKPYGLFLVSGLFPWIWVQVSLLEGTTSLIANAGLIRKAAFPAEILPVVPVLANLVHLAFALPVIACGFLFYDWRGVDVGGPTAFLMPLIILVQLPLVAGGALGFAALNAHFKDVRDLLTNFLTLLFFLTPILYTLERLRVLSDHYPFVYKVVESNPLTPFMLACQEAMFRGTVPGPMLWLEMAAISLAGWAAGTWLFTRLSDTLVESV